MILRWYTVIIKHDRGLPLNIIEKCVYHSEIARERKHANPSITLLYNGKPPAANNTAWSDF